MNDKVNERKPRLSNEQKQKLTKYAVFALMGVICACCIWLIYVPSAEEKAQKMGFNTEIPLPKEEGLIGDKRDAYEKEQVKHKQTERMRSLNDFTAMMGGVISESSNNDLVILDDEPQTTKTPAGSVSRGRSGSPIQNSAKAYQDINHTLGSFYEPPKNDPEKEQLKNELDELRERLDEQERNKNSVDEQMAVMERSYQVASKYLPLNTASGSSANLTGQIASNPEPTENKNNNVSEKPLALPVNQVYNQTVYRLAQNISDADFLETFSKPRNMGFFTAGADINTVLRNTIIACAYGDQTVLSGQGVRFRLLEHIRIGKTLIPRNTIVSGFSKIQDERLQITIHSLEFGGSIIPVELAVYDLDGQKGIFIPDLQELNAAKEIVANMGTSAGTSINLSNDAGEQFVADMGRNLIQGVSQFAAKKLREVKVYLKSGYRVYLVSEEVFKQQKNNQILANN